MGDFLLGLDPAGEGHAVGRKSGPIDLREDLHVLELGHNAVPLLESGRREVLRRLRTAPLGRGLCVVEPTLARIALQLLYCGRFWLASWHFWQRPQNRQNIRENFISRSRALLCHGGLRAMAPEILTAPIPAFIGMVGDQSRRPRWPSCSCDSSYTVPASCSGPRTASYRRNVARCDPSALLVPGGRRAA